MKPNLIIVAAIAVILIVFTVNKARGWGGLEAKVIPEEFDIEMKALSGEDVAKLYPGAIDYKDNKFLPGQVYVFGRALSKADRMAIIVIDITCKQVPYLGKKDLNIGWIAPGGKISPAFFLTYLGECPHYENKQGELIYEIDIHKLEMTYKIKKVFKK